jgi:hypothetical protein
MNDEEKKQGAGVRIQESGGKRMSRENLCESVKSVDDCFSWKFVSFVGRYCFEF